MKPEILNKCYNQQYRHLFAMSANPFKTSKHREIKMLFQNLVIRRGHRLIIKYDKHYDDPEKDIMCSNRVLLFT